MDPDATSTQNALAVLRRHFGEQLSGSKQRTEGQMRHTLVEGLGLSELEADRLLKQLDQGGQLEYVAAREADFDVDVAGPAQAEGNSATGPVISMPLTHTAEVGQPLITTASPAMLMGLTPEQGGAPTEQVDAADGDMLSGLVTPAMQPEVASTTADRTEAERESSAGYWRIG